MAKTFRTKRDAEDWSRSTEDQIIRGIYVPRNTSEKTTVKSALTRYLSEVTSTKKPSTQVRERGRAAQLSEDLGRYSLASLNANIISEYRDSRIEQGKSNNTVRLELALLSHLYTTAIREWRLGLSSNPLLNIRKPSPGQGRDRRLVGDEEQRLLEACDSHTNPFLGIVTLTD